MLVLRFPLIVLLAGSLLAQDLEIDGVVRRPSGEPVAGAQVVVTKRADWLFDPSEVLTEAATGPEGAFTLSLPAEWLAKPEYKSIEALVLGPEGGLTAVQLDLEVLPIGGTWNLELAPTEPWTLTLLQADGSPAAGVSVAPDAIGDGERQQICRVPVPVLPLLTVVTNEQGRATVTRWGREQMGTGLFVHPDGARERRWNRKEFKAGWLPQTFALYPRSELALRSADDLPAAIVGQTVGVRGVGPIGDDDSELGYDITIDVQVAPAGETVRARTAAGYPAFDVTSEHLTMQFTREGEEGTFGDWSVRAAQAIPARGRVVDAETGEGVEGATIYVLCYPVRAALRTDAEGYYRFDAKPPVIGIDLALPPAPYLPVDRFAMPPGVEVSEDMTEATVPDLVMSKAGRLAVGEVMQEDGTPAAGALVRCEVTVPGGRFMETKLTFGVTDGGGAFSFAIPTEGAASLTASHGGARTSSTTPVTAEAAELTLTRLTGCAGRVTLDGRAPGEGLRVEVYSATPEGVYGGEERIGLDGRDGVAVAADGTFSVPPALELDSRYCLVVTGAGVEALRSTFRSAREWSAAEVSLDVRALATVRGSVLGPGGLPIAGARVFARGDTTGAVETRTDAQGGFVLEGLLPDGGIVLVEGPDGLVAQHVRPGAAATVRIGGEAPELELHDARDRGKELLLARGLLIDAIDAEQDDYGTLRLFEQLAHVDPAEALARLAASGLDDFRSNMVRRAMMEGLRATSFDESVALAESMTSSGFAARAFVDLARASEDPGRRLALLGQALANARAVQAPEHRLVDLSHVAEALFDFGYQDEARELLVGAIPLADSLANEEWSGFARAAFAEELVHFDTENALRLVSELSGRGDPKRHLGNMAHELAATDPAKAEEILSMVPTQGGSFRASRFAPRVCHDMAPVDLERALRLADEYDPHGFSHGMIASALVATDPAQAREVLDEAFERLIAGSAEPRQTPYFSGVMAAGAALLAVSEGLGLEHLRGDLARVLALRQARPPMRRFYEQEQALLGDARVAFYAARYDPELARTLLEPAAEWLAGIEGYYDSDWSAFFAAAAVLDPEWATRLAREKGGFGVRVVAAVLGREGAARRRYVQDEFFHLWIPGKEDL